MIPANCRLLEQSLSLARSFSLSSSHIHTTTCYYLSIRIKLGGGLTHPTCWCLLQMLQATRHWTAKSQALSSQMMENVTLTTTTSMTRLLYWSVWVTVFKFIIVFVCRIKKKSVWNKVYWNCFSNTDLDKINKINKGVSEYINTFVNWLATEKAWNVCVFSL